MQRVKLILFVLNTYSAYALDRAGAEMFGGDLRRKHTMARRALVLDALKAIKSPAD
jgi:hypothetical protein